MAITLSPARLTTRLAAPARDFAARIVRAARRPDRAERARRAAAEAALPLAERLHVPIHATSPEAEACAALVALHAGLAAEERWGELLSSIRAADRARAAAPGGSRLAAQALRGALSALSAAIAAGDWDLAEAEIDRLAAVQAAHPADHVAAVILAQAHLDLGWAKRSAAVDQDPGRLRWRGFLSHTAEADRILEPFDPIEEDSPLLAATRYGLVRGLEDAEPLFRDWYEDWSDLDPTSPEPHAAHAQHLLPNWFGAEGDLDEAARDAVRRSAQVAGTSAYAVFYMSAADALGDVPQTMDLGLFLRGLLDYHRATGCQYRANIVAGVLTELLHSYSIDAAPGSMRARMVAAVLEDHLRENLREFHLSAWENGMSCIHWALEQVFGEDLARGAHVHVGPEGLEARLPG